MRNEVKGERERKGRRMMRYDVKGKRGRDCLLYKSPSPRDA